MTQSTLSLKKTIALLTLLCVAAFAQQKGTFTDARDGKKYKTVKIGTQIWMAENLNYKAEGSKCGYYNEKTSGLSSDNTTFCDTYGRLYNWETAMKACPKGWHLPGDDEWGLLTAVAGGSSAAGKNLKARSGWMYDYKLSGSAGSDIYGFLALPGGGGFGDSDMFFNAGGGNSGNDTGYWWTASESTAQDAYLRVMNYASTSIGYGNLEKKTLYSVRCVQN